MNLRIILPVKPFAEAKQRLSPAMGADARMRLAQDMFEHVFAIARAFAQPSGILVVSRGAEIRDYAQSHGATALTEPSGSDLNGALRLAAAFARDHGSTELLVLAGDLPLLSESDLAELTLYDCAIAPDRHGTGTNALLWPPAFDFQFGENSFERHQAIAQAAGRAAQIVQRPGLAHDIDLPSDLLGGPYL
jgi:2-phospho-L-lactate guanylyltransferase